MNKIKFYKEKETGKTTFTNKNLSSDKYIELKPNTKEASLEKHIPIYEKKDNKLIVTVGSVNHPMTEEHYIMWIALVKDDHITIKELSPNILPQVEFDYINNSEIYIYCNLHGLWKTNVE